MWEGELGGVDPGSEMMRGLGQRGVLRALAGLPEHSLLWKSWKFLTLLV